MSKITPDILALEQEGIIQTVRRGSCAVVYQTWGLRPAPESWSCPPTACTFLVFCLLYPPCVAALAAIRREIASGWSTLSLIAYELCAAWITVFIVRQIGLLLEFN